MRVRWALGLVFSLSLSIPAAGMPMQPDMEKMLEHEIQKKTYPPARASWNGVQPPRKPFNPIYEGMLYPLSGEALRDRMLRLAIPSPGFLLSIAGLIYLLRLLRRERELAQVRGEVLTVPVRVRPAEEAA